jgi:hypothetical protein
MKLGAIYLLIIKILPYSISIIKLQISLFKPEEVRSKEIFYIDNKKDLANI